jgi:hypothetical protein
VQQCTELTSTNRSIGLIALALQDAMVPRRLQSQASQHEDLFSLEAVSARRSAVGHDPMIESRWLKNASAWFRWSGGYGEGFSTRSHPELGRESPQRRWYYVLRRGRVGRRQASQATHSHTPSAPVFSTGPPPDAGRDSPGERRRPKRRRKERAGRSVRRRLTRGGAAR